jgi:hypothetical protein
MGLGLVIVAELTTLLGGCYGVESQIGAGSCTSSSGRQLNLSIERLYLCSLIQHLYSFEPVCYTRLVLALAVRATGTAAVVIDQRSENYTYPLKT